MKDVFGWIGSTRLDECNGKLMDKLQTMNAWGEILISHPNGAKMFYSLVIR